MLFMKKLKISNIKCENMKVFQHANKPLDVWRKFELVLNLSSWVLEYKKKGEEICDYLAL